MAPQRWAFPRPRNQTGVKLRKANPRAVVKTRARSSAPLCFDDGGGWSAQAARRSSSGAGGLRANR